MARFRKMRHTISWSIRKQDETEVRMDHDVGLPLARAPDAPTIGQSQLPLARKALEDGHDVLCGLVGFVHDDQAAEFQSAQ